MRYLGRRTYVTIGRGVLVALGIGCLIFAGYTALQDAASGIAVAAFLATSLFLLLLGGYGLAPSEINIGGGGIKLAHLDEQMKVLLAKASAEISGEVEGAADPKSDFERVRASIRKQRAEAADFEKDVGLALTAIAKERRYRLYPRDDRPDRFDYMITKPIRVGIDMSYRSPTSGEDDDQWIRERMELARNRREATMFLLVTNHSNIPSEVAGGDCAVVVWDAERRSRDELAEAIGTAMDRLARDGGALRSA